MANLKNPCSNHGCAKVLRKSRDYLIVYGGSQNSIELLDLSNKYSPWETSDVTLPAQMTKILGHVATVFDDESCEMMVADASTKMIYSCKENYAWDSRALKRLPDGSIPFFSIDASLFGPYFL